MDWLLAAFGMGLVGSLHCAGMCGPIVLAIPAGSDNRWKQFLGSFSYQWGRIATYSAIGFLFGIIGRGFSLASLQQPLSIAIGIVMIAVVIFPRVFPIHRTPLLIQQSINFLKKSMGSFLRRRGVFARFVTGLLNGFLPCGLVYMALLGALGIGSPSQSALFMFFFGVGTFPMMFAITLTGTVISARWRSLFNRIAPYVIIVLGTIFILRGMGIGIKYISPPDKALQIEATDTCH